MQLIRRAVFRAAASPSTSFISKPRSIATSSPFALRLKTQNGIPSSVFRRFASDEANSTGKKSVKSTDDDDHSAIQSAINSAAESTSTHAGNAAESLTENAVRAKDAIVDGAAAVGAGLGFSQRGQRRDTRPYSDRDGGRPAYGDRTGGDRSGYLSGGYGGGRGADRDSRGGRPPYREPTPLAPCPSIYVGNILFDVTASDLEREFGEYGTIKSAIVASDGRGLSKGFGYVEFETTAQATAAIEAKHQTVYEGRRLVVNYQAATRREAKANPPSKTIFIGNLAFEMSDADLNKLFRDIRNVVDVRVAIDRRTGQPRGFAHADFVDVDSAVKGLEQLQNKEIYGRKLRVDYSSAANASSGGARRSSRDEGEHTREQSPF